ncbi:filamentous hemagglutinin N-terminal domain-containing protein [Brasilonema sp. UFV-L1]|uniref:two-partner secretion domain-containing protein n=1 Tax=Brasilonema sp. UFV-L1 TaxID=2234130 RepID=UPI00145D267F|nr:filamentous hemagglutinin N-terminal domain-containing protein [Brasilonema sp. UFV-L1]NMG10883.1 hypothetical protein [Brasilonema sp. UFV-L1]
MTQVRRSPSERLSLPVRALRNVGKVHLLFLASLPLCMLSALAPVSTATAQEVSADGTVSTTVTSPDGKNFTINDGTTRGTNLFHSFKEFSVPTGGSAEFNNAANIQNIISRVTGGLKSNIDGLIKANGGANLFLLNPAGILFGANARLNIGGSFLGSTANSFIFENGFEFSATNLQAPPLLTINLPIGLRYGDNPGEIQVQGRGHDINFKDDIKKPDDELPVRVNNSVSGLQLESGKTLALVGGKVSLEGAILNSSSGRIEIGSVASNGVVSLVPIQEGWKLGYENIASFGDIQFSGRTLLDTKGDGGGSIAVAGKNINFTGESILLADTLGDRNGGEISIVGDEISFKESDIRSFTFGSGNAGQVKLIANKSILLENYGGASTSTLGLGKAGEISLKADSIEIRNNSGLGSYTYGAGNGGLIKIQANSLLTESQSGFGASSYAEGNAGEIKIVVGDFVVRNQSGLGVYANQSTGNGGKINITANSLLISDLAGFTTATQRGSTGQAQDININVAGPVVVQNSSAISSDTSGAGNAGKINITANSLQISDGSGVTSYTKQDSTGLGGEINLNVAGPVAVQYGSSISNSTSGAGNAGKISMTANSLLISDSSGVTSSTKQDSTGLGGEINLIVAGPVAVQKGSGIYSDTRGRDDAGKISMTANSLLISDGSAVTSSTEQGSTGLGGEINLNVAGPVVVRNSSAIYSDTRGRGNAGKISMTANSLQISNRSGVTSDTKKDSTGLGGEIIVNVAGPLILQNSGINSNTESTRNAGQITVSAESLEISNSGAISTSNTSISSGNAGNLNVRAKTVILDNDGRLRVSSTGSGDAGTLNVVADTIRLNNQSLIDANSTSGNGGNITLDVANLLQLRRNSLISATSGTRGSDGQDGNITINTKFLIAFPQEDSDIVATGFGRTVGSNVQVNASGGIFGIQYQPQLTPESDIVATGTVTLITLNTDPSDELFRLPQIVIDPAEQIAQNPCLRGGGEFTIVGRGGFPADPNKVLSTDNARVDLVKPVASTTSNNSTSTTKQQQPSTSATDKPIVPARGWIFNEKGEVVLVAYDPTKTGVQRDTQTSTNSCAVR